MYMMTPKRLSHYFLTSEGAETFAAQSRASGCRDVVVVPNTNVEDLAKGYGTSARVTGATVVWTEDTSD
jgi:hypothetical protein